ncbi:MAG TPA: glycosyltransferase family 9 protein, partial [Solimonas sp.]
GETRLAELPAWLAAAKLVIGVDTGLTHIGIAVGTPTVALFGSTCPYRQGADSPLIVMYDALPCAPCRRHPTCDGRFDCMRGLTPQRVAIAATQLLRA